MHLLTFPFHLNSRRKERFHHRLAKETLALQSVLMGPEVPVDLGVGKFHHRCARKVMKPPTSCEQNKALRAWAFCLRTVSVDMRMLTVHARFSRHFARSTSRENGVPPFTSSVLSIYKNNTEFSFVFLCCLILIKIEQLTLS